MSVQIALAVALVMVIATGVLLVVIAYDLSTDYASLDRRMARRDRRRSKRGNGSRREDDARARRPADRRSAA